MKLTIRPLSVERWPALADLFDTTGPCGRCWCMQWRIGPAYRQRPAAANRRAFRRIVTRGPAPGLLAFDGDLTVGWCQLTPRDNLPWLHRSWPEVGRRPGGVWSISCFYIRVGYRKCGISDALLAAAIKAARRAGAAVLEAYPLDGQLSPSSTSTGYVSMFERAGFKTMAYRSRPRPLMQLELGRSV